MEDNSSTVCKVGELALVSGIKKQVLRRHDRNGLLTHHKLHETAQHLYTRDDLIRLEKLAFMQLIGLSRSQIKQRLQDREPDLLTDLRIQRNILLEKRKQLNRAIYFIEYGEQVHRNADPYDWHYLGNIVEAIETLRDPEMFRTHYLQRELPGNGDPECG